MRTDCSFDYHYGDEAEQYAFYRIPKILFTHKRFKNLSCEAKVLYGLMLDRMRLSVKNRWLDEQNRVYIIFRIDNIMAALQCAEQKANKLLAELDSTKGIGLIERKRQGLGKPNIIYVKNFVVRPANPEHFHDNSDATEHQENIPNNGIEPPKSTGHTNHNSRIVKITNQEIPKSLVQICENHKSRSAKTTSFDLRKSQDISNNEYSDIDTNDTDSINLSISSATTVPNPSQLTAPSSYRRSFCQNPEQTAIEHIESYCNLIRCNIDYDVLCERYSRERLDELVEIMAETVCSQKRTTSNFYSAAVNYNFYGVRT